MMPQLTADAALARALSYKPETPIRSNHHEWAEALNSERTGVRKGYVACMSCGQLSAISEMSATRCPRVKAEFWSSGFTCMDTGFHCGSRELARARAAIAKAEGAE